MIRSLLRALTLMIAFSAPALADVVSMQSAQTGQIVGVDGAGLLSLTGGTRLTLEMIPLTGNRVAFRDPQSGLFLRAGVGQDTLLAVASPHIRGWETFEMIDNGRGVALRSVQNGQYVGADPQNPQLAAVWGTMGMGQRFHLVRVGAAVQPRPPVVTPADFNGAWQVTALFENGRAVDFSNAGLRRAHMAIDRVGAVIGTNGCNQFDAQLSVQGGRTRVEHLMLTRARCYGEENEISTLFNASLTDAFRFERVQGGQVLEISDSAGRLRARLQRM